jgi:hypothetical protein
MEEIFTFAFVFLSLTIVSGFLSLEIRFLRFHLFRLSTIGNVRNMWHVSLRDLSQPVDFVAVILVESSSSKVETLFTSGWKINDHSDLSYSIGGCN